MGYTCEPAAREVAKFLGFTCDGANPVVTLRSPFSLENWTLPVLELLIVGGAVFALVHAWRRWRRDGDPVNISLAFASLVYLAVIEPPLYFPEWFNLEKYVGFIFSHNVFTVQFMFDRLPLYIVAFYVVITQLTYELIRALGVFQRRGPAVGAIATAFACQVFYETFDQLGPQLKWWAWNPDNDVNKPMFASVPMNSMWVFASVSFGVMTWLVVRFVGDKVGRDRLSGWQVSWRTVLAGVLTPVLMVIGAAPTRVDVGAGDDYSLQKTLVIVLLALLWLVGGALLVEATKLNWHGSPQETQARRIQHAVGRARHGGIEPDEMQAAVRDVQAQRVAGRIIGHGHVRAQHLLRRSARVMVARHDQHLRATLVGRWELGLQQLGHRLVIGRVAGVGQVTADQHHIGGRF